MPSTLDTSLPAWNRFSPPVLDPATAKNVRAETLFSWFAYLLAFCVPWSDMVLLPYAVQFTRLLSGVMIICWLISWRSGNCVRRVGLPMYAMSIFIVLVPMHFITSDDPEKTARRLLSYLGLFCMTLFFQQNIRSLQTHRLVLASFVAGCCIPLASLLSHLASGVAQGDGRYTARGFDPNDLAGQFAMSIPVATYLALNLNKRGLFFWLYLPLAAIGILLTASRAGLVVLGLVCLYPAYCLVRNHSGKLRILVLAILTAGAIYLFAPSISFHRLSTIGDELSRRDLNGRGDVWNNGMELFWQRPVVGIGAGAFAASVGGSIRMAAHNTFLEVLVEHGMLGLAVFSMIVIGLFTYTRRCPPSERLLWQVNLAAWTVLAMTLSWENREITWLIWGLCLSLGAKVAPRESRLRQAHGA